MTNEIIIRGAKEHNLKNIDINIPRNKLVVITGLSGSGKSSLAFDTLYAEGQRRYVESLSAYARQFLGKMHKPNVEYIEGLSPAISIEQRTGHSNPRSTVGTTTEIFDYLRLLFSRVGIVHCPACGKVIRRQTRQEIVDQILKFPAESKIIILAPLVKGRKGEYAQTLREMKQKGYLKARIDGKIQDLDQEINLDKNKAHTIDVVIDRLVLRESNKKRLIESTESALKIGEGIVIISLNEQSSEDTMFSELNACLDCSISLGELTPRMFSFNSPYGACTACHGLGTRMNVDPELVINVNKSLNAGAVIPWVTVDIPLLNYNRKMLTALAENYKFSLDVPFKDIDKKIQKVLLYGTGGQLIKVSAWKEGKPIYIEEEFEGIVKNVERRYQETTSNFIKEELASFMNEMVCPDCNGARLKKESLSVTIGEKSIFDVSELSIKEASEFFHSLKLTNYENKIAKEIIKEIKARLKFMSDVGLAYLTLNRKSGTLSGGEAQRIRLATQIGSKLVGVLYVLDEPSIGLHPRDNIRLLNTLQKLRDLGNSVVVVEHDEETIREADFIVDLGPGAGINGGYIVEKGSIAQILKNKKSLTGQYLNNKIKVAIAKTVQHEKINYLEIKGAAENNLKNIDVKIPLGMFCCVTGVSGSGKSTLIDDILRKGLQRKFYNSKDRPGKHKDIIGVKHLDKVTTITQTPIGRTPRSNPATYTGLFSLIRDLYTELPESKLRGYQVGRFSFNVKGGRCEACKGDGIIKIDMHFLPTVYIECEACKGKRFNRETLEIEFKGKNISDVLNSTVDEAVVFFKNFPKLQEKLQILSDVGLGYIKLGQPATTLSGGEAQRIKLSAELSKKETGKTLYILDEPTTGLHFADVHKLLEVLRRLVDAKNTVLVVEHNLDVIKSADYIIDLGPEGGDEGGQLLACGSVEEVINNPKSYTGQYLKKHLLRGA